MIRFAPENLSAVTDNGSLIYNNSTNQSVNSLQRFVLIFACGREIHRVVHREAALPMRYRNNTTEVIYSVFQHFSIILIFSGASEFLREMKIRLSQSFCNRHITFFCWI